MNNVRADLQPKFSNNLCLSVILGALKHKR